MIGPMRLGRVTALVVASAIISSSAALAGAATKPPTKKDVAALEKSIAATGRLFDTSTAFDGTQMVAADETPFGAIALGLTDGRVSVWTTKDAKKWTRVPEEALGAPATALDASTTSPTAANGGIVIDADADGTLIVIGNDVFTTKDGKRFTYSGVDANGIWLRTEPVEVNRLTFGNAPPLDAAVGPKRSVLVGSGSWFQQAGGPSPGFVPTFWSSTDREHWTGQPIKGADATPGFVGAVVALDDGTFVAAGADTYADVGSTVGRGDDAAVWTSADGTSWTRADAAPFAAPGTQEISYLAARGDRLVAAGFDSPGGAELTAPAFWTSSDAGRTWTRAPLDPAVFPPGSRIKGLVSTPRGFVASGVNGSSVVTARWAYWTSPDGQTWTQAYNDEIFSDAPTIVFPFGKEVVAMRGSAPYSGSATVAPRPASTSVYVTGAPPPPKATTTTTGATATTTRTGG